MKSRAMFKDQLSVSGSNFSSSFCLFYRFISVYRFILFFFKVICIFGHVLTVNSYCYIWPLLRKKSYTMHCVLSLNFTLT